jgi:t-SNARE complex subunit (syntaxin)
MSVNFILKQAWWPRWFAWGIIIIIIIIVMSILTRKGLCR